MKKNRLFSKKCEKRIFLMLILSTLLIGLSAIEKVWNGSENSEWHNSANWTPAGEPWIFDDVTIPDGTPNNPMLFNIDNRCRNLVINSGASLRFGCRELVVSQNVKVFGNIDGSMYSSQHGMLTVGLDMRWESGSSFYSDYGMAFILTINRNLTIEDGTHEPFDWMIVQFRNENYDSIITNHSVPSFFGRVSIEWGGANFNKVFLSEFSSEPLRIRDNLTIFESMIIGNSFYPTYIGGIIYNMTNQSHFQFNNSSVIFSGSSEYFLFPLKPNTGDYFNDLTINTGSNALQLDATYSNTLEIKGDLSIESGVFKTESFILEIGGNWTNNVGSTGFSAGNGEVIFVGNEDSYIANDALFYNLSVNKTEDHKLGTPQFITISVNNDLSIINGSLFIKENSELRIGESLIVENGGTIELSGSIGNEATVKSIDDSFYNFEVQNGGKISANYGIFQKMDWQGIHLLDGSIIDSVNSFRNCTFSEGITGGSLLTIDNAQDVSLIGINFPEKTIDGFNLTKNVDMGCITLTGAVGEFAGELYDNDPHNRINWVGSGADLIIANVEWSDTEMIVGETANVTITIRNIGDADITDWFYVDLYYNLESPPENVFGDECKFIEDGLLAGEIYTTFFSISSGIPGIWNSYVKVDIDEHISESDETNNTWGPDHILWHPLVIPSPDTSSDISEIPIITKLIGNYPNPFNPETTIKFDLATNEHTRISIYNLKGQKVKSLLAENLSAGYHSIVWNGKDDYSRKVPSGIYFYKMLTSDYNSINKMILMK